MSDVVISYASEDSETAMRLKKMLSADGLDVFSDTKTLVAGEDYDERTEREMAAAKAIVVLLSRVSKRGRWVEAELQSVLQNKQAVVVPVLLDEDATNNWVWPLISDRQAVTVNSPEDLTEVARTVKESLAPSNPPVGRYLLIAFVTGALAVLAGIFYLEPSKEEFVLFLRTLPYHWVGLMLGAILLASTFVFRTRGRGVANRILCGVAALCLLVSFYQTWDDVRDRRALSCHIERVKVDDKWPDSTLTQVFVLLSVTNPGAPRRVDNYKAHIQASDVEVNASPTEIPRGYRQNPSDTASTETFDQPGSLLEMTSGPIEKGREERGWLRFIMGLPEVTPDLIDRPGVNYTVTVSYAPGKVCRAEYVVPGGMK